MTDRNLLGGNRPTNPIVNESFVAMFHLWDPAFWLTQTDLTAFALGTGIRCFSCGGNTKVQDRDLPHGEFADKTVEEYVCQEGRCGETYVKECIDRNCVCPRTSCDRWRAYLDWWTRNAGRCMLDGCTEIRLMGKRLCQRHQRKFGEGNEGREGR